MLAATLPALAESGNDVAVEVGGGVMLRPSFEGSGKLVASPFPDISFSFIRPEGASRDGFRLGPAFNVIGERNEGDAAWLLGMGNIKAAYELGLRGTWRSGVLQGHVEVRRGFGGHESFVSTVGADLVLDSHAAFSVEFGPRLEIVDQAFMQTYYGVTAAQAAASALPAYSPGGGLKAAGFETKASYALNEQWSLNGTGSWLRLVGDAAKSPIAERGSKDQFTLGASLTYRFELDLFN